jgi:hypothetical protein
VFGLGFVTVFWTVVMLVEMAETVIVVVVPLLAGLAGACSR